MKTAKILFIAVLSSFALGVHAFAGEVLNQDREINFSREVWLKIKPPCVLRSSGSKLTAYPQDIEFGKFVKMVRWNEGMPGHLVGTDEHSKTFDFDLDTSITIRTEMVLRIIRTTMHVTTNGLLVVEKGSEMPEVLKKPKVKIK